MESITHAGFWWLPSQPENQIPGTLTFSDADGGKLELIGSFRLGDDFWPKDGYPIILGLSTTSGKSITLQDCHISGENNIYLRQKEQKIRTQKIYVNYVITGEHFTEKEKAIFNESTIKFAYSHE
jgi:hypothetical protein